jgi:NTP pyrophosphatase (non-canonical NTP hydrolase)
LRANEYQRWTRETAIYPKNESVMYTALGLAGEVGEVANVVKKILRDDNGIVTEEKQEKLKSELGDVCWYLARLTDELGLELEDILDANVFKLMDRKNRNQLQGSGDNR